MVTSPILELCSAVRGMNLAAAQKVISEAGFAHRVTVEKGQIVMENITSDYNEKRLNLRIQKDVVQHARIG